MEDESVREGLLAPCCLGAVTTPCLWGTDAEPFPKLPSKAGWDGQNINTKISPFPMNVPSRPHSLWDDHLPQKLCFSLSNYGSKQGVQKRCLTTMK